MSASFTRSKRAAAAARACGASTAPRPRRGGKTGQPVRLSSPNFPTRCSRHRARPAAGCNVCAIVARVRESQAAIANAKMLEGVTEAERIAARSTAIASHLPAALGITRKAFDAHFEEALTKVIKAVRP